MWAKRKMLEFMKSKQKPIRENYWRIEIRNTKCGQGKICRCFTLGQKKKELEAGLPELYGFSRFLGLPGLPG